MSAINLFNAATAGFIIGWWMRDIGRAVGALLERAAPTPRPASVDDGSAEPVAGAPAAGDPGANAVEGPFGQSRDGSGGNRPDYGDDDGFHGESVSQKQGGRK